jgi:alpha/beta superfamily hydrolase
MVSEMLKIEQFSQRIDQGNNLYEKAFFFQNEGKNLFGILHLPLNRTVNKNKIGIVMCQPYLIEPLITQKLEIDIARSLAQNGFSVFRFHYRGCGDSEGDLKDATISSQISDTLQAIKIFAEQERLDSLCLLGIRLGGTIALMAAQMEERVKYLILCEPIIEPKRYFLDLFRTVKLSAIAKQEKTISTEQMVEDLMKNGNVTVFGYPLYKKIFTETSSLNLIKSTKKLSGKTLVLEISTFSKRVTGRFQPLSDQIQKNGGICDIIALPERMLAWNFILHPPFRSKKITHAIVKWCKEQIVFPANKNLDKLCDKNELFYDYLSESSSISLMEKPIFIQCRNTDLFGMLHMPNKSATQEKTIIILLTGASIPRTHRNRMWVKLARQLTGLGFFTFRFDYRGLGESTGLFEGLNLNKLLTQDLLDIVKFLKTLINPAKFILIGECFGARTALSIIHFQKFHGLVLLAAPTVDEDGRILHTGNSKDITYYLNKLKWQKWGTFLNIKRLKRNFIFYSKRLQNKWNHINPNSLISEEFSNQFITLVNNRIPSLLIYGTKDEYYENMRLFLQGIDYKERKEIEFYEVHGEKAHGLVVNVQIQEAVNEKILNWIVSRYLKTTKKVSASGDCLQVKSLYE